ncbi:MAG: hypothetical protein ACO2O4_04915 [Minisyncoccia bacterium]|jgi:hypothetical protein
MRFEMPKFSLEEKNSLSELIEEIERFENKKLNQNEKKEYLKALKNILAFLERKAEENLQNNDCFNGIDEIFYIKKLKIYLLVLILELR